jgi:hypothetical protein
MSTEMSEEAKPIAPDLLNLSGLIDMSAMGTEPMPKPEEPISFDDVATSPLIPVVPMSKPEESIFFDEVAPSPPKSVVPPILSDEAPSLFLSMMPPEMLAKILVDSLDESSLASVYLTSKFFDFIVIPKKIKGRGICVACVAHRHIHLFRYWLFRVPINDREKEYLITELLCETIKVTGGSSPGANAKRLTKEVLSIVWFDRWFLNNKVLGYNVPKVVRAAAQPNDAAHYVAVVRSMGDISHLRRDVLSHCIRHSLLNVAEKVIKPGELFASLDHYLHKAVEGGAASVRWVLRKHQDIGRYPIDSGIWDIIFSCAIRYDSIEMVDVLLDDSLFEIDDGVLLSLLQSSDHWIGRPKGSNFLRAFTLGRPSLVESPKFACRIMTFLDGMNDRQPILDILGRYHTSKAIHLFSLESGSFKIVASACSFFPTDYDSEMTTQLLILMAKRKESSECLRKLKFLEGSILESLGDAWNILTIRGHTTSKLYIVAILLEAGLLPPEDATKWLSSMVVRSPTTQKVPDEPLEDKPVEEIGEETDDEQEEVKGFEE